MRPEELYLSDIVSACRRANRFAGETTRQDFEASKMHQSAVLYNLMIIGEAVSRISDGLKVKYPEIDWQSLSGFRNIIVHTYFSLDLEIVWKSATVDALKLIEQIQSVLAIEYPDHTIPSET